MLQVSTQSLLEDAATVAKAVVLIGELSGKADPQPRNQIVRSIVNKALAPYLLLSRAHPLTGRRTPARPGLRCPAVVWRSRHRPEIQTKVARSIGQDSCA